MKAEYPTDEELKTIKEWDITKQDVFELVDFIHDIWWMPDWGFTLKGKRVKTLYLSTGGWSGNEDIIGAMKDNWLFWATYWEKSKRGGHYCFKIKRIK